MKLAPVRPVTWLSLLVLLASQSGTDANVPDICRDEESGKNELIEHSSSEHEPEIEITGKETVSCLLYPTNVLNCSWSFHTLQKEAQLSVYSSICEPNRTVQDFVSEERVGSSARLIHTDRNLLDVILHFNVSLHDTWVAYYYMYDIETLEVLPPPTNITASFKDGGLLVTWGLPSCRAYCADHCLKYNLFIDDQERNVEEKLSHMELHVDTTYTHTVRIRTMKVKYLCSGSYHWSEWSQTVTVQSERPVFKLNPLVIAAISLGIPMILLALLLFFRYQSLSKILFPPIPCPPPKYMHYLQKNDTFNFHCPAPTSKPEEEITEVLDTEETPGKTC